MSINRVILIGRLGQDPEMKFTQAGKPVTNFTLATSENWKDKQGNKQEKTEWHKIVVWGPQAQTCNEYLMKGPQAYVEGKIETRSYENKQGQKVYVTEIKAQSVKFLDAKSNSTSTNTEPKNEERSALFDEALSQDKPLSKVDRSLTVDDIPF